MNVISTLEQELKDKNYTDVQIMRYIYIRCCELFHFDKAWYYANYTFDTTSKKELKDKRLDIENIEDFSVICHSIAPIIKELVEALAGIKARVSTEDGGLHSFVNVIDNKSRVWRLDPTYGDMPRVKLNIKPTGMTCSRVKPYYMNDLDLELDYHFIDRLDYINELKGKTYRDVLENIGKMLEALKVKYHYTDACYFIDMFSSYLPDNGSEKLDKYFEFHRLYEFQNTRINKKTRKEIDEMIYFELCKENGIYRFGEISKERHDHVVNTLVYK